MGWCEMKQGVKYEELVDIDKIIAMYKVIRATKIEESFINLNYFIRVILLVS